MIPGFEDALIGAKAGEERVINPTFPEDYQNLDLAGKTAEFTVNVNAVAAPQLPELNAESLDQFGVQDGSEIGREPRRERVGKYVWLWVVAVTTKNISIIRYHPTYK